MDIHWNLESGGIWTTYLVNVLQAFFKSLHCIRLAKFHLVKWLFGFDGNGLLVSSRLFGVCPDIFS